MKSAQLYYHYIPMFINTFYMCVKEIQTGIVSLVKLW